MRISVNLTKADIRMAKFVQRLGLTTTYLIEMVDEVLFNRAQEAQGRNHETEKCRWPGCHSKPREGFVYCGKHIQGQGK